MVADRSFWRIRLPTRVTLRYPQVHCGTRRGGKGGQRGRVETPWFLDGTGLAATAQVKEGSDGENNDEHLAQLATGWRYRLPFDARSQGPGLDGYRR